MRNVCRRLNNSKRHKLKRHGKLSDILALPLLSELFLKECQRIRPIYRLDCDNITRFNELLCHVFASGCYKNGAIPGLWKIRHERLRVPAFGSSSLEKEAHIVDIIKYKDPFPLPFVAQPIVHELKYVRR